MTRLTRTTSKAHVAEARESTACEICSVDAMILIVEKTALFENITHLRICNDCAIRISQLLRNLLRRKRLIA